MLRFPIPAGNRKQLMAKKTPLPSDESDAARVHLKIENAITKLRGFHELGRRSLKKHGKTLYEKGDGRVVTFAAGLGQGRNYVERARQFARVFSKADVDRICTECREHQYPLGVTLVSRSLAVAPPETPLKLLLRAIREKWTQKRLFAEVSQHSESAARPGRPHLRLKNRAALREQIIFRIGPQLKWLQDAKNSKAAVLKGFQPQIESAIRSLQQLVEAAGNR